MAAKEIAASLGVRLVTVRPSSILGPGPAEPSLQTAKALAYYSHKGLYKHLCRRVPFIPAGGINFCDVRDVAQVATLLLLAHTNDARARTCVCVCARARARRWRSSSDADQQVGRAVRLADQRCWMKAALLDEGGATC